MMMRPPSFMCFSAAWVVANTPRMLMSITRSISSSVVSSNVFGMAVPALFTSTFSRPKVATAFSPLSSIALTTAEAALASFAYVMATLAPSEARRFAIAAPIPREPPVTSATFFANLDMDLLWFSVTNSLLHLILLTAIVLGPVRLLSDVSCLQADLALWGIQAIPNRNASARHARTPGQGEATALQGAQPNPRNPQ